MGLLGLTYIFPKMMCISGQDFVDQIDTSSGLEKYSDFSVGDTVTISDSIARIEYTNGQTLVWLETIGKSESDPPFRFGTNIMGDFGVGNSIIIEFEVVQDNTGDFTLKGYENEGVGLSSDTISSRYSTLNEYIFMILILGGIGSICYGGYTSFIGSDNDDEPQDDWGFSAQTAAQPPVAPPPMTAPPIQQAPSPMVPTNSMPPAAAPSMPSNEPTSMTITVPSGVVSGQVLTVTLPDGRAVNVQVPAGCNAGSQFTITVN